MPPSIPAKRKSKILEKTESASLRPSLFLHFSLNTPHPCKARPVQTDWIAIAATWTRQADLLGYGAGLAPAECLLTLGGCCFGRRQQAFIGAIGNFSAPNFACGALKSAWNLGAMLDRAMDRDLLNPERADLIGLWVAAAVVVVAVAKLLGHRLREGLQPFGSSDGIAPGFSRISGSH